LKETFRSDDQEAQALSLDMFWELLKFQSLKSHVCTNAVTCEDCRETDLILARWVDRYCSGEKFSEPIKESLIAFLMESTWSPVKAIPFNQRVQRPGIWQAFFLAMQGAPFSIRQDALKDVSALLVNRPDNAMDLIRYSNWQSFIVPFTFTAFDDFQRSSTMSINLLTLIHFHTFNVSKDFVELMCGTLHLLRQYEFDGLFNQPLNTYVNEDKVMRGKRPLLRCESLAIARNVLELLCLKVTNAASSFSKIPNPEEVPWANLQHLCQLVSIFIFSTPKWNHLMIEDEDGSSINWSELFAQSLQNSLSKFRLHRVPTPEGFTWAMDTSLAQKVLKLLTELRLGKIDDLIQDENPTSKQKDFITEMKNTYLFFKDTVSFLKLVGDFEHVFGWDKDQVSFFCLLR
jgi:hypothetical protein